LVDFAQLKQAAIKAQSGGSAADGEEFVWGVVETVLSGVGNEAVATMQLVKFLREVGGESVSSRGGDPLIPNPYFVVNGHGGRSPITAKYLRNRRYKSIGGTAVGAGGAAVSIVSQVDIGGGIQHGSALATTGLHWAKLDAAGRKYRSSQTISGWVDACIRAKQLKAMVRTTNLASAVIPVPASQIATGAISAIAKMGIKLTIGKLIARTAMEIHWRARVEGTLGGLFGGGSKGPQGPAGAIMHEIFTRRGATRIFGKYDTDGIIREPGGWLALNDKLMLM